MWPDDKTIVPVEDLGAYSILLDHTHTHLSQQGYPQDYSMTGLCSEKGCEISPVTSPKRPHQTE